MTVAPAAATSYHLPPTAQIYNGHDIAERFNTPVRLIPINRHEEYELSDVVHGRPYGPAAIRTVERDGRVHRSATLYIEEFRLEEERLIPTNRVIELDADAGYAVEPLAYQSTEEGNTSGASRFSEAGAQRFERT